MNRFLDILFSTLSIILFAPIFVVIAILIRITSNGPIFYSQNRVGLNGKEFKMFKFRSMKIAAEQHGLLTVGEDPRITKIGYWLRKYKLDELPQLFNVLVGQMSMVGPRPEVKKYVDLYSNEQKAILYVRPGITDMASIKYRNENALLKIQTDPERYYVEHIMPEKIKLNYIFLSKPSTYNYLSIIFLTVRRVFSSNP